MSAHYEVLMDLWQNGNIGEFYKKASRYLDHQILSPEKFDRIFKLLLKSLPENVVADLWQEVKKDKK
jgi:hypothetical protein